MTIRVLKYALLTFCVLDLFFPMQHHAEYFWHLMPAFDALYGFLGSSLLVVLALALGRHWLWREVTAVPAPAEAFPEGISEATVRTWLVREGDFVQYGQDLVELEIGSKRLTLASPQAGHIHRRFFGAQETLTPGETLVHIRPLQQDAQTQVDDKVIIHG